MLEIRQTETFRKWFSDLKDINARTKILVRIRRLSLGNAGDVEPVGNGISELRIRYGPGYRVYFTKKNQIVLIILCGGNKASQQRDIKLAKDMVSSLEE